MSGATSNLAITMAEIVVAYPDRAAVDLHEIISHKLSTMTPARRKEVELGLLVEHFETRQRFPTRDEYREATAELEAEGEFKWQTADQLCEIFGSWSHVISAATYIAEDRADRLVRRKSDARVARDRKRAYSRDECKDALIAFFDDTGDWPSTGSEYQFWQQLKRRHALLVDENSTHHLPSSGLIKRKFGDWERAIDLAKKKYAQRF